MKHPPLKIFKKLIECGNPKNFYLIHLHTVKSSKLAATVQN